LFVTNWVGIFRFFLSTTLILTQSRRTSYNDNEAENLLLVLTTFPILLPFYYHSSTTTQIRLPCYYNFRMIMSAILLRMLTFQIQNCTYSLGHLLQKNRAERKTVQCSKTQAAGSHAGTLCSRCSTRFKATL